MMAWSSSIRTPSRRLRRRCIQRDQALLSNRFAKLLLPITTGIIGRGIRSPCRGIATTQIITSERTKENLTKADAGVGGLFYIEKQLEAVPKEIAKLKDDIMQASNAEQKARLESNLQGGSVSGRTQAAQTGFAHRTINNSVTLNEGGREIELLLLGRGHTDGDVFIYLPQEKVVASGDALIDWMPFLNDGYPEEWVQTLDALEKFDFMHIIPGHGEVVSREHLSFFRGYLADLIAAVKKAADGGNLDEMKESIPDMLAATYEQGMSKYPLGRYRDRVATNIQAVYDKVLKKA